MGDYDKDSSESHSLPPNTRTTTAKPALLTLRRGPCQSQRPVVAPPTEGNTTLFSLLPTELVVRIVRHLSVHSLYNLILAEESVRDRCVLIVDKFSFRHTEPGLFLRVPGLTTISAYDNGELRSKVTGNSHIIKLFDLTSLYPAKRVINIWDLWDHLSFVHFRGDPRIITTSQLSSVMRSSVLGDMKGEKIFVESCILHRDNVTIQERIIGAFSLHFFGTQQEHHIRHLSITLVNQSLIRPRNMEFLEYLKVEMQTSDSSPVPEISHFTPDYLHTLKVHFTGKFPYIHDITSKHIGRYRREVLFEVINTAGFGSLYEESPLDRVTRFDDYPYIRDGLRDLICGVDVLHLVGVPDFWVAELGLLSTTAVDLIWRRTVRFEADEITEGHDVEVIEADLKTFILVCNIPGKSLPIIKRGESIWETFAIIATHMPPRFEECVMEFLRCYNMDDDHKDQRYRKKRFEIASLPRGGECCNRIVLSQWTYETILRTLQFFDDVVLQGCYFKDGDSSGMASLTQTRIFSNPDNRYVRRVAPKAVAINEAHETFPLHKWNKAPSTRLVVVLPPAPNPETATKRKEHYRRLETKVGAEESDVLDLLTIFPTWRKLTVYFGPEQTRPNVQGTPITHLTSLVTLAAHKDYAIQLLPLNDTDGKTETLELDVIIAGVSAAP